MTHLKSYTDLEQSKVLAKILSLESADMWYNISIIDKFGIDDYDEYPSFEKTTDIDIPCWSLAALLSVIPKEINIEERRYAPCLFPVQDMWLLRLWHNSNYTITSPIAIFSNNPIDAYYEIILKLHKQNLL